MDMIDPDEVHPEDVNSWGFPRLTGSREWEVLTYIILTKPDVFYEECSKLLDITKKQLSVHLKDIRKKLTN
jgi:hypothetical protein